MIRRFLKAWRSARAEFRRVWHDQPALVPQSASPHRFRVLADYGDGSLKCIHDTDNGGQARRTYESVQSVVQRVELWDGSVRRGHWDKRTERKRSRQ